MASSVSSTGDYTIIYNTDGSGTGERFAVRNPHLGGSGTTLLFTPPNSGIPAILEGAAGSTQYNGTSGPATFQMAGTSGHTFELYGTPTRPAGSRLMLVDQERVIIFEKDTVQLQTVPNGALPSTPSEGRIVLEQHPSSPSMVRVQAYLDGAWRSSAWMV